MTRLRDDIKVYIESTLGVEAHLNPASELRVPFHIKDAYTLLHLNILISSKSTLSMLLLLPVEDGYPGAVALGKHITLVRKATDEVVVYVCKSLSAPERRSLIAHHINFIQPGYQMFIPELAMDLRESVRTRRNEEEVTVLLPAAQAMLLGCLTQNWGSDTLYTSNAIMGGFNYSRVTLSKVINQLLKLRILEAAPSQGFMNVYSFGSSRTRVFSHARRYMRSPVKRKVAIDRKLPLVNGIFLAGETALAKYTMLAEPVQPVYGMTKKQFDAMVEQNALKVADSVDETRAWVEIWAYRSLKTENHIADEASLLLSLEDNPDERIQIALDEIKEKVEWLKSED